MDSATLVYIALALMFVLPGIIAVWTGAVGSEWVFRNPAYSWLVRSVGLGWSRVIVVVLGLLMLGAALLVVLDPMDLLGQSKGKD